MPSDTFAVGIEAAARCAERLYLWQGSNDLIGGQARENFATAIRALTPTASEATAIGAGEVTRAMEQAYHDARNDWSTRSGLPMDLSFAWPRIVAASPKVASIPAGMKPWAGGEAAPDDWDGGQVAWVERAGHIRIGNKQPEQPWAHGAKNWFDIIAYSPKVAIDTAPGEMERMMTLVNSFEKAVRRREFARPKGSRASTTHYFKLSSEAEDAKLALLDAIVSPISAALAASPTASDTDTAIPGGEVTQADRDRAIALEPWLTGPASVNIAEKLFARHRIAASPKPDTDTGVEGARLRAAIEAALQCTPEIMVDTTVEDEDGPRFFVRYDCGDPWEILRAALAAKPIAGEVDR